MPTGASQILFVTALPAETKPLVQHFGLKRQTQTGKFVSFSNAKGLALVQTGVGRIPAAVATTYALQTLTGSVQVINLGLAGCRDADTPIGSIFRVNKIHELNTGRTFFLDMLTRGSLPETGCITADQPVDVWPDTTMEDETLCDMEASAVLQAARQLGPADHFHCLKVVSDYGLSGGPKWMAEWVESLLQPHLSVLESLVEQLALLEEPATSTLSPDEDHLLKELIEYARLTTTQANQLKTTMVRASLRGLELPPLLTQTLANPAPQHARDRKAWLTRLRSLLLES